MVISPLLWLVMVSEKQLLFNFSFCFFPITSCHRITMKNFVESFGKVGQSLARRDNGSRKKALEVRCNGLRFLVPCVPNIVNGLCDQQKTLECFDSLICSDKLDRLHSYCTMWLDSR